MVNKVISRESLDTYLKSARPILVGFTKKDGEKRKMVVTTNPDFLPTPPEDLRTEEEKLAAAAKVKARKENNPDLVNVYSVYDEAWRSFDYNALFTVSIDLTEGDTIPSYNGFGTTN